MQTLLLALAALATTPAIDRDFPDPAVIRAPDGFYYAFGTQGGEGQRSNIQVARSRDLKSWESLPDALPVKPRWAAKTQDFWAPDVVAANGRYYLYYSAKPDAALTDKERGLCLAVATATRPQGPFVDKGAPLLCGPGFVNIDPMAYDDPATGKRLLYWGSGFGPIKVQELAPDRLSFAAGSKPIDLVFAGAKGAFPRLVEGAWITRRAGSYYLFFSGDNCCGPNANYATMVARSRSATGPFDVLRNKDGSPKLIIAADERWLAPGHNSVIKGPDGQSYTLFHAVDRKRTRASERDEPNTRRVMLVGRLGWRGGWPYLKGNKAR